MTIDNRKWKERQLVIFKLVNEEFGVDISEVREIIKYTGITTLPDTESCILGVISLRGNIIPIIDLEKKLSLPVKEPGKDTRIIIIETKESAVGMVVDFVTEVLRISTEKIAPAPKIVVDKVGNEFIEGVGVLSNRLIILLDLVNLVTDKDMEKITAIHSDNLRETLSSEQGTKKRDCSTIQTSSQLVPKPEYISSSDNLPAVVEGKDVQVIPNQEAVVLLPVNKNEVKRKVVHTEVPSQFHFITHEAKPLKNVHELYDYIHSLDEDMFRRYVNEEKNDFYNWIKYSVKDNDLAEKIKHIKNKNNVTKEILNRIIAEI